MEEKLTYLLFTALGSVFAFLLKWSWDKISNYNEQDIKRVLKAEKSIRREFDADMKEIRGYMLSIQSQVKELSTIIAVTKNDLRHINEKLQELSKLAAVIPKISEAIVRQKDRVEVVKRDVDRAGIRLDGIEQMCKRCAVAT